jgi:Zn-finger nucleic acid-binding protein
LETSSPIEGAQYEGTTGDVCPACGHTLDAYRIASMPFGSCPNCRGMWLVKDELRKLKNRVEGGSLRWLNDEIENIEKAKVDVTDRLCVKCRTVRLVSVIFGKSAIPIDWCPQCHGMWLDRGAFASIIEYLKAELQGMRSGEIEKRAVEDVKRIWNGGPGHRLEEAWDAEKAISALINTTIFEHPRLFALLNSLPQA